MRCGGVAKYADQRCVSGDQSASIAVRMNFVPRRANSIDVVFASNGFYCGSDLRCGCFFRELPLKVS